MPGRTFFAVIAAAGLLPSPAFAADCPTGTFRAVAGPDTASMLEIGKDGHFRYVLNEGALDEGADGKWSCANGTVKLTTEPTPKPAEYKLDRIEMGGEAPFKILVTWPDGRGIAAIDFRLDFDKGEPVTGYTQDYGWTLDDLDGRTPRQIQFSEPFHGTVSPVFPIPQGKGIILHVVLTPNDLGTADFREAPVTSEDGKLLLHWRGRVIPYAPMTR